MVNKPLEKLKNKKKAPMPKDVKPMLATLVDVPVAGKDWLYEVKWDGFRALSYLNKGKVAIRSRNNKSFDIKFYPVYDALKEWKINAVVDGEIIVVNEKGHPDFSALQTWRSEADGDLVYYLFDILWLEGFDLTNIPLKERKAILKKTVPGGMIRHSDTFEAKPDDFLKLSAGMGLEGIIAKKADSIYRPGARTKEWLKIKNRKQQEVIIAGYTLNEKTPKPFSALITGIYEDGVLIPLEPVGTGFNIRMQEDVLKKLKPLETKKCPFPVEPDYNKPSRFRPDPPRAEVIWVKPELVAEISYQTVASDGSFRHPSFKGLRPDKDPKEVVWEEAQFTEDVIAHPLDKGKLPAKKTKSIRKTLLNPADKTQVRNIEGKELKFTNLNKIFWPKDNISKRDMLNYYYRMSPHILPYLNNRPQTLNRFPNGIDKLSFYQKDVKGKVPAWVKTFSYYSETDEREKEFFVCTDEASLLYAVNLGCIELNPWSSRAEKPDNPDWCIIDLDPDNNKFEKVIEAANVTLQVLDAIGVPSYCKTSGSTGLHIYIPLGAKYDYEDSKEFARAIVKVVHKEIPSYTSIERMTSKRKGKLYLDFLQNRPQATVVAPYSLRPKPGATVSMPINKEELKKGLKMKDFTIHNAVARVNELGDIFKGVLAKGIDIKKALKKLKRI